MIYKHYKGNLYFVEGYAVPFQGISNDRDKVVAKAKYEPTLEEINIISIYDSGINSMYYAYDNHSLNEVMVLYRGLDGQHWLRPKEDFHGKVNVSDNISKLRFERINTEKLFELISELTVK